MVVTLLPEPLRLEVRHEERLRPLLVDRLVLRRDERDVREVREVREARDRVDLLERLDRKDRIVTFPERLLLVVRSPRRTVPVAFVCAISCAVVRPLRRLKEAEEPGMKNGVLP